MKAGLHHYLGLVKGVLEDFASQEVKAKRTFYGLRAALAARWIIEKRCVPPMTFDSLKEPLERNSELNRLIENIRVEKAGKTESFKIVPPSVLRTFLEETLHEGKAVFESLPNPGGDKTAINDLFSSVILSGKV